MTRNIEMQLREAIVKSGMSRYELSKQSGVTNSQLSLFVNRERSLTLTSAAKVARVLGLELRPAEDERKVSKKAK